jgi:3-oxoacyl-[acyl-carrier-protein] synthase III
MKGEDLDLLLFSGVYRDEFLCEPAVAAMIAGDLKFRSEGVREDRNSFAFDVLNGSLGFLNAIQTSVSMIQGGKADNAIVLTSEIENNRDLWPDNLLEIEETGAGMILEKSTDGSGFDGFAYKKFPQYSNKRLVENMWIDGKPFLELIASEDMNDLYIECIVSAVKEWEAEGLVDMGKVQKIFLPQISSSFIQKLANALHLPPEKVVDATKGRKDLYTASIPFAMQEALQSGAVRKGDTGLIISAGSGILVGCAHYYF